jgi:hypothetical protein
LAYHEVAALHGRPSAWRTGSGRAAAHVRGLLEGGLAVDDVAELAGLNPETVRRVLRGRQILSTTARALLAL